MNKVIAIAAMDEERGIGVRNTIPWRLPEDQKHFQRLTTGHSVLMGRNTYESLPDQFRPLPNRKNIVASRQSSLDLPQGVLHVEDPIEFIDKFKKGELKLKSDQLWIVGGEQIYSQTMRSWDMVYLTLVSGAHKCDTYFPEFEQDFELLDRDERDGYAFLTFKRP